MIGVTLLQIIDWLLWTVLAASTLYILIFAIASLFAKTNNDNKRQNADTTGTNFLVLFPAYREDSVIVNSVQSVLQQDYPKELFHISVISDHMQPETNEQLSLLPITLLQPSFYYLA